MKLLFQISLMIFAVFSMNAQQPVDLNCIEVDGNGNAILRWIPQGSDIDYHVIYFSSNGSTFDSIDNVPAISFVYNHLGADADLSSKWYFIKTVGANGSFYSDTLRTIYLQVDNNIPDYNQATLYWNSFIDVIPDGYSQYFKIFREFPIGNWVLYDSVFFTDTIFSEPIIVCNDSITYRIVIENSIGCASISNLRGAVFKDVEYPFEPLFDSVSINHDEYPVLGWTPSESEDVTGYIVYRFENNNWLEIDRIGGRDSTAYIDSVSSPCEQEFRYAIAALDSCANKSPGTFQNPRNTILLNEIVFNVCEATNSLNWSAYENADPALDVYAVYFSTDGINFNLAAEVSPDQLSFVHSGIETGMIYSYYIRAKFGDRTSSSCIKSVETGDYTKPSYSYFANADVLPSNAIELTIDLDTTIPDYGFYIYRQDVQSGFTAKIDSIESGSVTGNPFVYIDQSCDPQTTAYFYYVDIYDSCGKQALISNENKTVYLEAENMSSDENILSWNAFEGWDAGVSKYYIFRMVSGLEPLLPVDSVDANTLEYADNISGIDNNSGHVVYWVQAIENEGNIYGFRESSNSNRASVEVTSEMFLPNAFRPGGNTPEFKPVYRFYSGDDYLLQVYNRWGQLIFESINPDEGWDGRYNGNLVPLGVYIYKMTYLNPDRETVQKRGTVTVIY